MGFGQLKAEHQCIFFFENTVFIENNNLVRYPGGNFRPIVATIAMSRCEFLELLYKVCGFDKHMVE